MDEVDQVKTKSLHRRKKYRIINIVYICVAAVFCTIQGISYWVDYGDKAAIALQTAVDCFYLLESIATPIILLHALYTFYELAKNLKVMV